MYEAHFGLISRTFGTKAEGPAVFVGPQQAELISGIHKGLAARDAVVTVTGPVGVGKTTVVNRALETIHPGRMAAWVGRMTISSEEVLELLLAGFGFKRKTNSTLQRFAAFRRLLHERAATGIPVAIVIEDARKLGAAALAEVEALTAADTADGGGANIILMGEQGLEDLLADPDLARLKQRIRRRQRVEPLSKAEVQGYLKHAIRAAGGDYDNVFGAGVADVVAACSEGIPRVINTLCETALNAAMEAGKPVVKAEFMHQVAVDAFGFEGDLPVTDVSEAAAEIAVPAAGENFAVPDAANVGADIVRVRETVATSEPIEPSPVAGIADADIPESARNIVVESGRYPLEPDDDGDGEHEDTSGLTAVENTASHRVEELIVADDEPTLTDIPELINDTQPGLDVLPESAVAKDPAQGAEETFDLDAALSPEVESTNMMPGVTADLDAIADAAESTNRMPAITEDLDEIAARTDGGRPGTFVAPTFNPDELPTLSDSMRVEVTKEVGNAPSALDEDPLAPAAEPVDAARDVPATPGDPKVEETAPEAPEDDLAAETPFDLDSVLESRQEKVSDSAAAADEESSPASNADVPDIEFEPGRKIASETPPDSQLAVESQPQVQLEAVPEPPAEVEAEPAAALARDDEAPSAETAEAEQPEPAPADDSAPVMADPLTDSTPVIPEADLTALQAALDGLKPAGDAVAAHPESSEAPEIQVTPADANTEESGSNVPDITLDQVIAEQQSKNEEMDKFAEAIGSAGSLEEISEVMAETLFGEEFDEAAAAAVAMGPVPEVAEGELVVPGASNDKAAAAKPNGTDEPAETSEDAGQPADSEVESPQGNGLRDSVALRIDVLNKMKGQIDNERTEAVEMGDESPQEIAPESKGPQPEPIERQINTSMTQTLEALNVANAAEAVAAEKAEKKSGGFFSRFRRSS